jgi:methylphosphotriester-DNA--protein-cysteine methyltransferase
MEAKSPAMFKAMLGETSEPAKHKPQAQPKAVLLVGSKNSDKYHNPSCTWAGRISDKNLVTFASKEEAERAGYVPCKVCRGK